jgi:hypothetical protein
VRKGGGDAIGVGYRKLDTVLRSFAHQLERIGDQVEALTLGARASDYTWFKNTFPQVGDQMREGVKVLYVAFTPPEPVITREVYLRGLDFVTTTALHWQEFPTAEVSTDDDGAS